MTSPPTRLDLADFDIDKVTFEIRYDNAYLLWDRAGLIWSEAQHQWPSLTVQRAEPNNTIFLLDRRYELGVELKRTFVNAYRPAADLGNFIDILEKFVPLVNRALELSRYIRIGFRLFYVKPFADADGASAAVLSTGQLRTPAGRHFNIDGKPLYPECFLRWEGKTTAVRVHLAARSRKLDFEPTPEAAKILDPVHSDKHEVLLDIDYYTLANVTIGQFRVKDWLTQAFHIIKRDSGVFLGGE